MMKKTAAALLAGGLFALSAQAEMLGAGVGAGIWSADPSGTAQYGGSEFDLTKDAGFSSESSTYIWAYLNHPIPVIPNVRLEQTGLSFDGKAKQNIDFGGTSYAAEADTKLDLTQSDVLLYWGVPLIPVVDIDFGVGAKMFSGEMSMKSVAGSEVTELDFTLPVGYLSLSGTIPTTDVTIGADTKMISYDSSSFSDTRAYVSWVPIGLVVDLAIEAGYRSQSLVVEDLSGVDAEIDFTASGLFGGVAVRF
jgi:outer membrane protein